MDALGTVLVGVAVVVGGVLILRLHAFLALILAALAVAILTPSEAVFRHELVKSTAKGKLEIVRHDAKTDTVWLTGKQTSQIHTGLPLLVFRPNDSGNLSQIAELVVQDTNAKGEFRAPVVQLTIANASDLFEQSDIIADQSQVAAAKEIAEQTIGMRVAGGFGNTCTKIGILIAMAAIIGKCLLDSGAADRIVRAALSLFGERAAPLAFINSGFLLGIPVFFDTVFYLMIPLGKALNLRTGRNYLLYVLSIVIGATMAHSLVPPTPGPLFVADALRVEIGTMILAGCVIGIVACSFGFGYAVLMNQLFSLPLRSTPDLSLDELKSLSSRSIDQLPPLWLSVAPILLPVILIAGNTIFQSIADDAISTEFGFLAETLGNKNIALVISAAVAMATLVWQKRISRRELAGAVQSSLASGGVIILITSAGGAFGAVMQQTGVARLVQDLPEASPTMILVLAFLVTMAVRTAQGSATVAMITAVGILAALADPDVLGFHPVYLALAIGCGSKPVAWMNDSGFWVICRMSGMTESEGLKFITPMSIVMGVSGLLATIVAAAIFPMTG